MAVGLREQPRTAPFWAVTRRVVVSLPTLGDNLAVPLSKVKNARRTTTTRCVRTQTKSSVQFNFIIIIIIITITIITIVGITNTVLTKILKNVMLPSA